MSKVAVIYWTGTGNTEMMAQAIAEASGGTLFTAADFDTATIGDYDAVALGCPSMGAEELEDGEFEPMYESIKSALSGKKVALFGSYDWGDGEWMRLWQDDVEGLGGKMVADGLICHLTPEEDQLAECRALGEKLL